MTEVEFMFERSHADRGNDDTTYGTYYLTEQRIKLWLPAFKQHFPFNSINRIIESISHTIQHEYLHHVINLGIWRKKPEHRLIYSMIGVSLIGWFGESKIGKPLIDTHKKGDLIKALW